MKPHVQSSILLIVTLLIGVLLGALLQSSLREKRIRHLDFLRSSEGFVEHLVAVIEPTTDDQDARLRAILSQEAPEITSIFKQNRERIRTHLQEMEQRLVPLLDEEQRKRLQRRLNPPRRRSAKKADQAD